MINLARRRLSKQIRPAGAHRSVASFEGSIAPSNEETSSTHTTVPSTEEPPTQTITEQILDLARWAPSGDNTQPWRFEIVNEHHVVVHGFDTREHCVYDLDGHPSQIALGGLLETISIAATGHRLRTEIQRRPDTPETRPTFDVHFEADPNIRPEPLIPYIRCRSVQRRAMHTRPLTNGEKAALEASVGQGYRILWLEGFRNRLRAARLMFNNAKLRLTLPEAYEVHRSIIEWHARYSEDRVPDQALGVDRVTTILMRWVMQSWRRVEFFNTFLAGTWAPRIQMDLIPGIACAAHFVILDDHEPDTIDDYVAAGRAVQRLWLTATKLGLQLQPEMTPLIFGRYARQDMEFSKAGGAQTHAGELLAQLETLLGKDQASRTIFMGRIGGGQAPAARSLRQPLGKLLMQKPGQTNDAPK